MPPTSSCRWPVLSRRFHSIIKSIWAIPVHRSPSTGQRPRPVARPRELAIDPVELVPWLPYVSMMELHYDPFRVRYRVVGTEVARIIGEDFSNTWLDETGWGDSAIALNRLLYERVAEQRAVIRPFDRHVAGQAGSCVPVGAVPARRRRCRHPLPQPRRPQRDRAA